MSSTSDGGWSDLSGFSAALRRSDEERDARRKAFSDELEKRTPLFVERADDEPEWRWEAWFKTDDGKHFVSYQHWANGYADRPSQVLDVEFVRKLSEHV